ncbi:uncharacterized protein [Nicotiana tomentosiformis]|uniref:uncharacterized protein n=1 Tax=Nicotiana tomentosiformis TaxID=4098 RepID=UPI00388CC4DB
MVHRPRGSKTYAGVHQLESTVAMQAQIIAMAKDIKQLTLAQVQTQLHVGCDICGMGHPTHECQATAEEVNAVGNFNRGNYQGGNNFNAMGQRHPGFSWSSPNGSLNSWQQSNLRPQGQGLLGFQNQQRQQYQSPQQNQSNMEDLMKAFINKTGEIFETQGIAIRNLERQMGQIANLLCERAPGTLPSDTEKNPKKTIKATETLSEEKNEEQKSQNSGVQQEIEESRHMPALPFPQKMKREKLDKCFGRFLEMLKQLYMNIPFTEVLTQMPAYAKFLKEIPSSKRKLEETTMVKLNAHCSASINLMPLSVFKKLEGELGVIKSIPVSLQLADHTTILPEGIIKDILVRVDKFVFPVDFIVVDMEVNKELMLRVGTEKLVLQIKRMMKYPCDEVSAYSCFKLDIIGKLAEKYKSDKLVGDTLERCITQSVIVDDEDPEVKKEAEALETEEKMVDEEKIK